MMEKGIKTSVKTLNSKIYNDGQNGLKTCNKFRLLDMKADTTGIMLSFSGGVNMGIIDLFFKLYAVDFYTALKYYDCNNVTLEYCKNNKEKEINIYITKRKLLNLIILADTVDTGY